MIHIKIKLKNFVSVLTVAILLVGVLLPLGSADNISNMSGFERGPSFNTVIPIKKTIFVNFDTENLIDDYSYLAAVPTAVFNEDNNLYSYPLLYYQDEYDYEDDKERSLNAYKGLDYFMQDWSKICNNNFDEITLINLEKDKVDKWGTSKKYTTINSDNPFDIANEIALNDWSFSNDAVIAIIQEEYEKPLNVTSGEVSGTIPRYDSEHKTLKIERPVIGIGATYEDFEINDENYKYIITKMRWKDKEDYDLQLYDDQLGMVQVAMGSYGDPYPYSEVAASFIHNYGKWEISISAVPKKSITEDMGKIEEMYYSSIIDDISPQSLFKRNTLNVDIDLFPGSEIQLPHTPFGCRNIDFTLKWKDPGINLGFTVLDPVGNEIACSVSEEELLEGRISGDQTKAKLSLDILGECRASDNYKVCVFALEDLRTSIDYTLEYSWQQNFSKTEGDCLASASNGAVLASALNSPLLYSSPSGLRKSTEDVLLKLGVKDIYIVNIGNYLSKKAREEIKDVYVIKGNFIEPKQVYDRIREITGQNDIIFSTIDPWDYWYVDERVPAGTYPGALHIGPASLIAAHHGSPVILVDIHPRLSQAITYPTEFWRKQATVRYNEPSSGGMLLSGRRAYEFFEDYDFGRIEEGKSESQDHEIIITVAGQFDIGIPWDRSFTGAALPGRFWASPVDSAYSICRNILYPIMIYANPGMEPNKLIQGSASKTEPILGRIRNPRGVNLRIYRPMQEVLMQYPVLQTYNTFQYRFNEKASLHWNFQYTRADGVTPYEEPSPDIIDDGAVPTKSGAYYPDQSETEVIPFYAAKAGYSNVFSTNFEYVIENLNRGVLIWILNSHGDFHAGGNVGMWNPESPYVYEENPWRAYEPVMYKPGHLRTYIHWLFYLYYEMLKDGFNLNIPLLKTISSLRPIKLQLFPERGSTDNPDVAAINPQLVYINKIWTPIKSIIQMHDLWATQGVIIYRDRILRPLKSLSQGLPLINFYDGDGKVTVSPRSGSWLTQTHYTGIDFDDNLENLHSMGVNTISCLPAATYLHLTWMRHGASYQIIDPWTTTDWSASWTQLIIKRYALGDTLGEAYEKGMRACGPQLLVGQWWWDIWENVCLFGDPNLRVYVPDTEFSDNNNWERPNLLSFDESINLNGHMPFGATNYPNKKEIVTKIPFILILGIIVIILLIIVIVISLLPKKRNN
jgi:hypothetical protein